jgi:hypothetical protein
MPHSWLKSTYDMFEMKPESRRWVCVHCDVVLYQKTKPGILTKIVEKTKVYEINGIAYDSTPRAFSCEELIVCQVTES